METAENSKDLLTELTISFLSGNISPEERSRLEHLLKDSAENQQLFNEIKLSWDASGSYSNSQTHSATHHSWDKIKNKLTTDNEITGKIYESRPIIYRLMKTAALWLLLISIGAGATWFLMKPSANARLNQLCIISTPLGSKSHMVLPDGTDVWLNAGTTLKYPGTFSATQRDIYLSGEAYFKVTTNSKWPFVVHTPDLNIKALGTSFNVKAYPTEKVVTTTLVEGMVKLESEARKFSYTLKPKQEVVFNKEAVTRTPENTEKRIVPVQMDNNRLNNQEEVLVKQDVDTETTTSWKDKRWIISGEPVENLSIMLERRYNIKVNIRSEELKEYKFTGTIENETLEQVLKYLSFTIPVKYTLSKGFADLSIDPSKKEKYQVFLKRTQEIK